MKQPWAYLTLNARSIVQASQQGAARGGLKSCKCTTAKLHQILESLPFLVTAAPYQRRFISSICVMSVHLPKPLMSVCRLLL